MTRADPVIWAAIAVIAVGTFALRFSFLYLFERVGAVPEAAEWALQFVAPAVLAALVAPALIVVDGAVSVVGNDRLAAGLVGAGTAWRTESIIWTMVAGVGALTLLQQFL